MGSIKGFIDWVKGEDMEENFDDFAPVQREETLEDDQPAEESSYNSASTSSAAGRRNNVVNINTTAQLAVVLVKPDRF